MNYNRIYNSDSSSHLDIPILGTYNNSYDGTQTLSGRVDSPYQIDDVTNFNNWTGTPSEYVVTTLGNRVAVLTGVDNAITNELLNNFFKKTDIDFYGSQTKTYTMLLKDNNGSYPYLKYESNDYRKSLKIVLGETAHDKEPGIYLLYSAITKYTYNNGYGYKQENVCNIINIAIPVPINKLAKMLYDMESYYEYNIVNNENQGFFSTSICASRLLNPSESVIGALTIAKNLSSSNKVHLTSTNRKFIADKVWQDIDKIEEKEIEKNDDGTYNDGDGEGGKGEGPSSLPDGDTIDKITIPTLSPISLGIYNIYKMSVQQFRDFKSNLWNNTVMDYLTKIWQSNPMDSILSVALAPFTPKTSADTNIYIGGQTIPNATGSPLVESYVYHVFNLNYDDKIGTVWGNKYDYDGVSYTLFVPFVGFQKLTVNDIYHKSLELNYIIETLTGNGICYLYTKPQESNFDTKEKNRPTYTWSFNCYSKIPLSGRNMDSFVTGVISGVGGALSGNLGGITTLATARPTIQRSGELKANSAYMGGRRPFIVCEYSNLFIKKGQYTKQGRPSWRYTKLSNCSGFTKCKDAQIECANYMTQDEANEINQLLNEGVIL